MKKTFSKPSECVKILVKSCICKGHC